MVVLYNLVCSREFGADWAALSCDPGFASWFRAPPIDNCKVQSQKKKKRSRKQRNLLAGTMSGDRFTTFDDIEQGPADPILGVKERFLKDGDPAAVNVSVGAYRDALGKPLVLNVVKKAEKLLLDDKSANKEYLPIAGGSIFRKAAEAFCFDEKAKCIEEKRVASVQALSGTGALRVAAEFIMRMYGRGVTVMIPDPTWGNHWKIFQDLNTKKYRYLNRETLEIDFDGLIEDLSAASPGTMVVLHACAHNPSGTDLNMDQWKAVLKICTEKQLLPLFDAAYLGFATADFERDARAVRLFEKTGMEMIAAMSFAKSLGLYGERVGLLSFVCKSEGAAKRTLSQLELVIRPLYSNPPRHGAAIAGLILTNPELFKEWQVELQGMVDRMTRMRQKLREAIEKSNAPGDWSFITKQIGMFAFTHLTSKQVERIEKDYHVYMPSNGRISIAALTDDNVEHVAKAIRSVL